MAALREWGFGDFPMVEIDAPVCHVEEVYWLDDCFIEQMPAQFVQAARADMLARLGPRSATNNIYIRRERTRTVANAERIEKIARRNGFSVHELEGMTPRAQMQLFQNADFVVAPHGAGLANLLFCAPGTKVIEFSPECEFRPWFSQLSDKLDLAHAVLPCPTHDGGFFGRMTVDPGRFKALLRQLQFRQTDE
jgi:capsular polysaccharide biosynthesis protein